MAKLKMKLFEIAAVQSDGKKIFEQLQKIGAVELDKLEDNRFTDISTKESVAVFEKNITVAEEALKILDEYAPMKSAGLFPGREEIDIAKYVENAARADKVLGEALKICSWRKKITDARAEIVRCETALSSLKVWEKLDIPMRFDETSYSKVFVGSFPKEYSRESLMLDIAGIAPDVSEYDVEICYSSKEITTAVIVCHKSAENVLYGAIRALGFVTPQDPTKHPPEVRIDRMKAQIENQTKSVAECEEKLRSSGDKRSDIRFLYDYLTVKRDEYENLEKAKLSGKTIILYGYVTDIMTKSVEKLVSNYNAAVTFFEPSEEDDVPVVLHNNKFCEPVEGITEMYALPGKKDIDPSSVFAFFYYVLFGMMLSDAGYGLVMAIGTALILNKTNIEGSIRKTMKMFFYCGISTTFWGALFGSWFGDIVPQIFVNFFGFSPNVNSINIWQSIDAGFMANKVAPNLALWFEPIKNPIKLLIFSFLVGICHLFVGLITFGVMKWREGDKVSAILDTVPIIMLVVGAAPLAGSILVPTIPAFVMNIAKYVAIAGAVLIVLTSSRSSKNILARFGGGLYGLYNVASGYLSDILSYSRLLALGLATGSIASVINMMGVMPKNLVVKGILLVVVFFAGHALNMAINVLGAYVHTNRLQFVELFGKFYEGGGRAFEPLKVNTKYYKLKEENNND